MSADRINYVGSALAALDQALNTEAMLSRNDVAAHAAQHREGRAP